jgi:hypothetical protein
MEVYKVIGTNRQTGEKGWRYLVSLEEKVLLGHDAEFEQVTVDPAVFLENKATRSAAFDGWLLEHQWKAEGRLFQ